MTARLDGFNDIEQEVSLREATNSYQIAVNFTERLLTAYNLKVEKQTESDS